MTGIDDVGFSVVVPLYNHAAYIEGTLQSVLNQSLAAREIIVVDDGSKDNSFARARNVLAGCRGATVLTQVNAGAHATINAAIACSTQPYIAVLNSDDRFLPTKLARCAQIIASTPEVDLIFGKVDLIDEHDAPVTSGATIDWLRRSAQFLAQSGDLGLALWHENFATTTSNFVFTRRQWQRNGGFKALRYCHDLDFLLATNGSGVMRFDEGCSHIAYRLHPTNTIKESLAGIMVERLAVLADALHGKVFRDRRRSIPVGTFELFRRSLDDKGGPHLLAYLAAQRSLLENRDDFYAWAIADRANNLRLRAMLEGGSEPMEEAGGVACAPAAQADAAPSAGRVSPAHSSITAAARPTSGNGRAVPGTGGGARAIVLELPSFDQGGLEKVVLDSAILLRERGLVPIIVTSGKVGLLADRARAAGLDVHHLGHGDQAAAYRGLIERHNIKLGVSHFARAGYPVFRAMRIPNVTFIHNIYAFLRDAALADFKADDHYVDRYISVSPKATDYAVRRLGIAASKILTVPNGLIIAEHEALAAAPARVSREEFGLKASDYVFLNVASYNLHKGHYLMADALRLVLTRRRDIKVLCIGNVIHPPHVDELRAHLARHGLDQHLLMPGYFENVADFHRLSDAFLMPSLIEGWSIAMNEAMFHEKPLLMSDTGGAAEVIEADDIGRLIPNEYGEIINLHSDLLDEIGYRRRNFRTASYLAQAMIDFAENREHWRAAGRKGREKVLQRYDFSRVVDEYVRIFADLIDAQGRSCRSGLA